VTMAARLAEIDRAWRTLRRAVNPVVVILLRPRVVGREHVPTDGPVLIVTNHESWWDIPALGWSQPRSIRYMAKRELYGYRWLAWLLRWGGAFPVRRGEPDREAFRIVHETLEAGGAVGIFIQGHRQAELEGAKAGAGRCAVVEDVAVVPAAIRGTGSWRPGRRIGIVFGAPRRYERGDRRPSAAYRETADELMADIRRLYELAG
jgi:1-acyl-sn-glycerol-3-phosphate acyltransferase